MLKQQQKRCLLVLTLIIIFSIGVTAQRKFDRILKQVHAIDSIVSNLEANRDYSQHFFSAANLVGLQDSFKVIEAVSKDKSIYKIIEWNNYQMTSYSQQYYFSDGNLILARIFYPGSQQNDTSFYGIYYYSEGKPLIKRVKGKHRSLFDDDGYNFYRRTAKEYQLAVIRKRNGG